MKKTKGKRKFKIKLGVYFTMIVMVEIVVIFGASIALSNLFTFLLWETPEIPEYIWILIFSIVFGGACSIFVNRFVLSKISNLSKSMSRVAHGEFDIELETDSKIGEIQEIYRSFNLMTRELGATEILQTDFVSNVSHEFKTPINAIEGYATLLQDTRLSDSEREEYVEKIIFNTKRLSSLVGNILLISKLDNQAIETKREKYRLDEQIRQAIVMLESRWTEKDIELDVELECVDFVGNESLTQHIWLNLIGNAIKFDPVGGEVRIRLTKSEDKVIFSVEDSGPGIAPEAMNHIFDKFYQSDSSHRAEGNGLGLALVKSTVDLLGGKVYAENRPESGARFCVILKNSEMNG